MRCSNCNTEISEAEIKREMYRRTWGKRKVARGREPKLALCPKCGLTTNARQRRQKCAKHA